MHDTALQIGALVFERYLPPRKTRVLEIGSYDVNGSLRDHAPRTAKYVGLDFEAGKGVDHVVDDCDTWPVEDDNFDLVAASSVFEHDPTFWRTFLSMCRKAKAGGFIYISAPSNGGVHRFPVDCWRFYPDAGRALEKWGQDNGFDITLIESFVADRVGDSWNDFCAVFLKGPTKKPLNTNFVYERLSAFNVTTWRSRQLLNDRAATEDMCLLAMVRADAVRWQGEADALGARFQESAHEWEGERERSANETAEIRAELVRIAQEAIEVRAERARIQEEGAQVRLQLERITEETDEVRAERERLADELTQRHLQTEALDQQLASSRTTLAALEQNLTDKERETEVLREAQADLDIRLQAAVAEADTLDAARREHLGELATVREEVAMLHSRLAQRDEETSQAWARVQEAEDRHAVLQRAFEKTESRLADAEQWVGTLAKARTKLEVRYEAMLRREHAYEQGKAATDQRIENLEAALASRLSDGQLARDLAQAKAVAVEADQRAAAAVEARRVDAQRLQDRVESLQLKAAELEASRRENARLNEQLATLQQDVTDRVEQFRKLEDKAARAGDLEDETAALRRQLNVAGTVSGQRIEDLQHRLIEMEGRHEKEQAALQGRTDAAIAESQKSARHTQESIRLELDVMQGKLNRARKQAEWLRAIARFLLEQQKLWWFALPKSQLERVRARALLDTGLFDTDGYLARYPDVVGSQQEPLRHYLAHGLDEGRTPNDRRLESIGA